MNTVMKASDFIAKLTDIAINYKTLYVMGCFGAPMTSNNKVRYCNNHDYNRKATRTRLIQAASTDTFGFDCVCLIKAILWGWNGDKTKTYGGAKYKSNGVPDVSADGMIKLCSDISTDFTKIEPGEAVWTNGHIGVYIGDGLAVECTPSWKNKVQITACNFAKSGYNTRFWKKHGKLPYIEYDKTEIPPTVTDESDDVGKLIWDDLYEEIGNEFGTAAMEGNLDVESALISNNLQNSGESRLGFTNESYTAAVDNGTYTNFVGDKAGYGLAQWTSAGRKEKLLNYARSTNRSIGDRKMQLEYLRTELRTSYKNVLAALKTATSVKEASDIVLTEFECPKNQSEKAKKNRAERCQKFYDKYATKKTEASTEDAKPTTATTMRPEEVKMTHIKKGSKGKAVEVWQTIIGVTADGNFGTKTHKATIAFQKKAFPYDASQWDGIVGDKTWKAGLESI